MDFLLRKAAKIQSEIVFFFAIEFIIPCPYTFVVIIILSPQFAHSNGDRERHVQYFNAYIIHLIEFLCKIPRNKWGTFNIIMRVRSDDNLEANALADFITQINMKIIFNTHTYIFTFGQ